MRKFLVMLLLAMTALSGCLNEDGETGGGDETPTNADSDGDGFTDQEETAQGTDPNDPEDAPTPPEAKQFTGTLYAAGGCAAVACPSSGSKDLCTQDTPNCAIHAFTVEEPGWSVTVALTGGEGTATATPDYDLFLVDSEGAELGESTEPAGNVDSVTKKLLPGEYAAHVWAWDNQDAPYTLDIKFAF